MQRDNHVPDEFITFECAGESATVSILRKKLIDVSSPIAAYMTHDCVESRMQKIRVNDVDVETLTFFKRFVEHQTVGDLSSEQCTRLLYCANKYAVEELSRRCRAYLQLSLILESSNLMPLYLQLGWIEEEKLKEYCYGVILNVGFDAIPVPEVLCEMERCLIKQLISDDKFYVKEHELYNMLMTWAEQVHLKESAETGGEFDDIDKAARIKEIVGDMKGDLRPLRFSDTTWTAGPAQTLCSIEERDMVHQRRHFKEKELTGFCTRLRRRPSISMIQFWCSLDEAGTYSFLSTLQLRRDLTPRASQLFLSLWRRKDLLDPRRSFRVLGEGQNVFIRLAALLAGEVLELLGGKQLVGGQPLPSEEGNILYGPGVVALTQRKIRKSSGAMTYFYDLEFGVNWESSPPENCVPIGVVVGNRVDLLRNLAYAVIDRGLDAFRPALELFILPQ